jgi:putative transposase
VIADRWYPSSKTCSGCGTVKADLTLADRVYKCEGCGLVLDRDVNAAVNLAHYTPAPDPNAAPPPRVAA